jgi:hypothetical protein
MIYTTCWIARTSTPLLATDQCATKNTVISLHLPDNQWQLELQYWYSIAMAGFQRTLVQWATGQIAIDPTQLRPPETAAEKWFCKNLLIPSEVYQSFSVLGVVLILVIGCLVILVACFIEKIAIVARRCRGSDSKRTSWADQNVLNLFESEMKVDGGPVTPPREECESKDVETGGLRITLSSDQQRPDFPPGFKSFDSRCSTLQEDKITPQLNISDVSRATSSPWMDQPLYNEKELPRTPVTPRQVFETWRHGRKSKRHGFHA